MERYRLNKQDFELIDRLVKTTNSIETLYKKMYDLEISGKKDSNEYKKLLDYLKMTIEVEDKIYQDANLDYLRCIGLADYIIEDRLPDGFTNDVESIMSQNYDNRVLRRILSILFHKVISDYNGIKEMLPNELVDLMIQLGMPNPDKIVSQAIYSSIELQKAFEKDTFSGFLTFLQEFINKKDYANFKEQLISSKYNTSFINKAIESDMISSSFDIPETFYVNSRFVADLTNTDLDLYKLLKNSYGVKESTKQISEVIEMGDMDYSDPKKATSSILRQCLMRASFLLMSDEVISDVNYEFHEFVESEKYLNRHSHDRISEQLIINCFKSIKRDRSKPSVLSLGYRKN